MISPGHLIYLLKVFSWVDCEGIYLQCTKHVRLERDQVVDARRLTFNKHQTPNAKHPNFQMRDSRFQSLIFNSKIRLNIAKTWFLKSEIHSQMRKSTNAKQNRDRDFWLWKVISDSFYISFSQTPNRIYNFVSRLAVSSLKVSDLAIVSNKYPTDSIFLLSHLVQYKTFM